MTHFIGVLFALGAMWMAWPAVHQGWAMGMGVLFYISGMFIMFLASTLYHMMPVGRAKRGLRKFDHISIYVMIACSYSPICIGVIGGWLGWLIFGIQWLAVIGGTFYKLFAMDRMPKLSLAIYLVMGWSILFIVPQVFQRLSAVSLSFLLVEGIFYTVGTYFFAHDERPNYHWIWHIFVLLGAMAHWTVVLGILLA
ncbi:MAG: hemolysin III family protein [Bacteroidaceae bacterium]|nr:hemolysin III family protein [Bacteroidaceae bacterium]